MAFEPTWESLDTRECPAWFDEAKFGIFIHWGLYSVPAWGAVGQYAEWYWRHLNHKNSPTAKFHNATYGADFQYQEFVPHFTAQQFDPYAWAELFKKSGAQYVAPTSKHHDGYCLWRSRDSWNWNSVDTGPKRDLLGELTDAVRDAGLKTGFYYSLYEWYHPLYQSNLPRYVAEHMLPQLKDVVSRYAPSIIFSDGEWEHLSESWRSAEFLAWLYNESPCRNEVVVNDRWGKETRSAHGDYFTTEYGHVGAGKTLAEGKKWEENRGIGGSYGYNRNESFEHYATSADLIRLLVDMVSKGGNLLLNVGPTADGLIPVIMQERLLDIGKWLGVNGEAIYGSKPWRVNAEGENVRYTSKGDAVYAIACGYPGRELLLDAPQTLNDTTVHLLGHDEPLAWLRSGDKLRIQVPPITPVTPFQHAFTFKLENVS